MFTFQALRCKKCGHEWLAIDGHGLDCPECAK